MSAYRWRSAVHEAGHLVIAVLLGLDVLRVGLPPHGGGEVELFGSTSRLIVAMYAGGYASALICELVPDLAELRHDLNRAASLSVAESVRTGRSADEILGASSKVARLLVAKHEGAIRHTAGVLMGFSVVGPADAERIAREALAAERHYEQRHDVTERNESTVTGAEAP